MPLPQFLLMILTVLLAAALSLLAAIALDLPGVALIFAVLTGAALIHFGHRDGRDNHDG
ncbi:MAG: hypothetical protein ABGW82_11675 [Paracoccus sp. (in: a-proteobacteria)]|jgi:hypothetical protein|uniref:hypothetical protein n=1 Tax=unclassified Paracoccus (in: a-proteobacteria) TaxID=2688777 RepID=UPI0025D235C0|nr:MULTISPECIES: hypothetical protein [unclassified Paracoccus (in: a-proteobacteria)]MCS5602707.1 hypothetical protein [Paracoccus sp. (in: a-proteobacteria)]|tara:strand:- start:62 stop:238 length:177 start_codon:yes stop_codon:yes gene_type:complete